MKDIEKLKEEKDKIQRAINDIEYKRMVEVSLPELKRSVGRCFKYRNSYGGTYDRWYLYLKIVGIDEKDMSFKTVEFQNTSMEIVEIRYDRKFNFDGKFYFDGGNYIEIKPSEFERAKKALLTKIAKILNGI